ncbi:MAG: hydrogenase iron-sulfur subunit [Deltaproteobacteria bacterium]|nr:hydrogenase iron-sulfur subunit [Deltaproteobacteria bacterium]
MSQIDGQEDHEEPGELRLMPGDTPQETTPHEPAAPKGVLRGLERVFLLFDRAVAAVLPETLNPLLHTGAIAVVCLLVATATGIILLIWYRPSVSMAWQSVEAMSNAPFTAGFLRSLHRYSSDASLMFGIIHALRSFLEGRFGGARWLAWVTGGILMLLLWSIGWSGYWLVWDMRAQLVAVGTAKLMDVLPIFGDPVGRSFLTDEGVNSLLFFVVFFFHMLVPLALAVVAWLHITRLSRARFLTDRPMTIWTLALLFLLCILYPATSAEPARMTALSGEMTMDWWYLLPLFFTERLSGGALWGIVLASGALFFSIPWWLSPRRPEPALVIASRCNECTKCYHDCPYAAIEMVARNDGNPNHATQAFVIESKCVSCGICAGSCDTAGIGITSFDSIEQRRRIEGWLRDAEAQGEAPHIGFICAESAGAGLNVDPTTGISPELPGFRLLRVPCAGWVHPLMVERALRHGAAGALIVTCGPGECHYREGALWTEQRMAGEREPRLRSEKVAPEELTLLGLDRTRKAELIERATALRTHKSAPPRTQRGTALGLVAATFLALIFAGLAGVVSDLGYAFPAVEQSELVVSFSHPGTQGENCRTLSEAELAEIPLHMRQPVQCDRGRSAVRLAVRIDGVEIIRKSIPAAGVWGDSNSIALERIPVEEGRHIVEISIGETANPEEWTHHDEQVLDFTLDNRRVVVFNRVSGFGWY